MEVQSRGLVGSITHSIHKKAELYEKCRTRYYVRSILACLFLTLGVVIAYYIGDKANHIAAGSGKFFYSFMFSWGLIMIIYMNAELGTSNMMYMTFAAHRKILAPLQALKILLACILFNAVGAVITSYLISLTAPFAHLASDHYLFVNATEKLMETPTQQFAEGIFANIVVNTAVFCSIRMKDDAGKVIAMLFIVMIFAFLGYEHVIANFSTFSLAYFANGGAIEGMTIGSVLSNFLWSGLGNYVGGGIFIGLLYSWLNNQTELYFD